MLFILKEDRRFTFFARIGTYLAAGVTILAAVNSGFAFYYDKEMGKEGFYKTFGNHAVYRWDFSPAKLISTIDPAVISGSLALIQKYSPGENYGIYIISKYDNLLPFMAGRYSLMPHFSLMGYLLDESSFRRVVGAVKVNAPRYFYADKDIEAQASDLWVKMMTLNIVKIF